jgi:hypothetical protein
MHTKGTDQLTASQELVVFEITMHTIDLLFIHLIGQLSSKIMHTQSTADLSALGGFLLVPHNTLVEHKPLQSSKRMMGNR